MKNITSIKSDKQFYSQLDETIYELGKTGSHEYLANKLITLREMALRINELKMPQEKYISVLRALEETGSFSRSAVGNKIAELINYFAFDLRI
ncbi:MAG TPA: hypothetical protein PKL31_12610 [Fulvivirga sp.]|nr:hypothetical protein [Fulvivirga sp.]